MPSDKHNSRIAGARDLISSLINIALSWAEMCLFTNHSCYSACIRVLPLHPFDLPFFSSQLRKVTICGRHEMASVRNIKIDEVILVLCLAYYVMKQVCHCRNWDAMAFTYRDMGRAFHKYIFRNGWMDCRDAFYSVLCLCNKRNKAEYEVNWLISVPIINYWGTRQLFFSAKWYTQIKQLKLLCFQKSKQTSSYKEKFVILQAIGII